jgi:hypothetical protein
MGAIFATSFIYATRGREEFGMVQWWHQARIGELSWPYIWAASFWNQG